jgi:4-hydroxybenzoate polyprenyltransferase
MTQFVKSGLKTFLPTFATIVGTFGIGILYAQILLYILNTVGGIWASVFLGGSIFLFAWIMNTITDVKLQKLDEQHERESAQIKADAEEFRKKFSNILDK